VIFLIAMKELVSFSDKVLHVEERSGSATFEMQALTKLMVSFECHPCKLVLPLPTKGQFHRSQSIKILVSGADSE
jgi:hypothetical protein